MCDVSDGLLADAGHLAADSRVVARPGPRRAGAGLPGAAGPLQQVGAALGVDPMAWVLTGGEDHALVATFPPARRAPRGVDGDRGTVADRPDAGVRVDGEPAADVAAVAGAEETGHVHFG